MTNRWKLIDYSSIFDLGDGRPDSVGGADKSMDGSVFKMQGFFVRFQKDENHAFRIFGGQRNDSLLLVINSHISNNTSDCYRFAFVVNSFQGIRAAILDIVICICFAFRIRVRIFVL